MFVSRASRSTHRRTNTKCVRHFSSARVARNSFKTSKLDEGVQVVSVEGDNPVGHVSVFAQAGSRYETFLTKGSTHFLKHIAFKNTRDTLATDLVRRLPALGGDYFASIGRDVVGYHTNFINREEDFEVATSTLEDALQPLVYEYEVDRLADIVQEEVSALNSCAESLVFDALHKTAFSGSGLAQSVYINNYDLKRIVPQHIVEHITNNFFPGNRLLVVGQNVDHEKLTGSFSKLIANMKQGKDNFVGYPLELDEYEPLPKVDAPKDPVFKGGAAHLDGSKTDFVGVAFPGASVASNDFFSFEVLKELINVTGEGVKGFKVENFSYMDTGLFCVVAEGSRYETNPEALKQAVLKAVEAATKANAEAVALAKGKVVARLLSSSPEQESVRLAQRVFGGASPQSLKESIPLVDSASVSNIISGEPAVVTLGQQL